MVATSFIIHGFAAICLIAIGAVTVHSRRERKTLAFLFLTLSLAFYLFTQGLATLLPEHALAIARVSSIGIMGSAVFCLLLFSVLAERVQTATSVLFRASPILLLIVFSGMDTFIHDAAIEDGWLAVNGGQLYGLQSAVVLVTFLYAVSYLIGYLRKYPRGNLRSPIKAILWAFCIESAIILIANTVFVESSIGQAIVPISFVGFVFVMSWSIVKYRTFDVKLTVVRTLAYILSLATMSSIYFALAYLASKTLFSGSSTTGVSFSPVNVVLALILAFVFQPIKQFFDRITNHIFYRDRYDSNEFITRLGRILTSTTRLHDVIEKAGHEIATTLKAGGSMIVVYRDHHADAVASWRMKNHFSDEEHDHLKMAATHFGGSLLVVESLERLHTHEARRLHALLAKRNVAVVLPLVTADETIGYLLLEEQMGSGYTKRDIEVLEAIADSLVIAIQNARSVQVVRDLNTHLEQRVNSATKELRASNKRLVELDATKDEFVSMASHQLRTPLTSIKGYLSMVLEGDVGKITPDQRQLLSEAFTSSERMVHLIGDFLNVSRLQTGKFVIDRRETDLAAVVSQEVESMKQIAESHGMSVSYRKPSVFPLLYIDDNKLRQVIMNFIDNAIYYSPDNRAPITVKLSVEDGEVVFRVIDKGMGVPAEVQKQLFGKFFRAENARKQRPDGTGIGLYLAKKVIDGHGGKLVFESVENKGSTFGFRLPIKKLSMPPLPTEDETKNTP